MRFDVITIFPEMLDSFTNESLLKRAQQKNLLQIQIHNLRNWTTDKHKTVDDKAFGGGLGMVLMPEPIQKAVQDIKKKKPAPTKALARQGKSKVILFTPRGKKFDQKKAQQFSKLDQLIMICGRYSCLWSTTTRSVTPVSEFRAS